MCKNLLGFLWNPSKHMREMNAWRCGPPPTLASISNEQFKALNEMRQHEEGSFEHAFHKARYEALVEQYSSTKKYREENGMLIV